MNPPLNTILSKLDNIISQYLNHYLDDLKNTNYYDSHDPSNFINMFRNNLKYEIIYEIFNNSQLTTNTNIRQNLLNQLSILSKLSYNYTHSDELKYLTNSIISYIIKNNKIFITDIIHWFKSIENLPQGGGSNYYEKYIKYKLKYLELKNK